MATAGRYQPPAARMGSGRLVPAIWCRSAGGSVGSRGDPLTAEARDTRAWHRTIRRDRVLLVAGSDHGVELLADRRRRRVRAAIRAFLRSP